MGIKELLELQANMLDIDIRGYKKSLIAMLDSLEMTLQHNRMRLENNLDDSMITDLNSLGIVQSQAQAIDSRCMAVVTKAKHLAVIRRIIAASEGE